jgi:hypothetical protein
VPDTPNPSGITKFLGRGERLVFEIWMCCFYHTSNAINLVTASVDASVGIVEHTIFIPDVVDGRAPTHGVIFAKYVAQITKQQSRHAVGHDLSPLGAHLPHPTTYDALRLDLGEPHASLGDLTHPSFLRNCLFRNLGECVLFQMLRIAVEFADAFGELLGRHGVFVVHPAESFLGEMQLYIFDCFRC